jgi:hypothetical protein
MIHSMENFSFSLALDINMGYYHIKLDADVQKLCKIEVQPGRQHFILYIQSVSKYLHHDLDQVYVSCSRILEINLVISIQSQLKT